MALLRKSIFTLLVLSSSLYGQIDESKYIHFSVEEGLSSRTVHDVIQDHLGFIWFANEFGLNKFDGRRFVHYFKNENDSTSLPSFECLFLFEDSNNNLWIGTGDGLVLYNRYHDNFISFRKIEGDSTSINNSLAATIVEDNEGYLWVGTWDGVCKTTIKTSEIDLEEYGPTGKLDLKFKQYNLTIENDHYNYVSEIMVDNNNNIWMGGRWGGIHFFGNNRDSIIWLNDPKRPNPFPSGTIYAIQYDGQYAWIGTWGDGLFRIQKTNDVFIYKQFTNQNDFLSNDHNEIQDIIELADGNLLLGHQAGISVFDKKGHFDNYSYDINKSNFLLSREVRSVYADNMNGVWIATTGGGVSYLPPSLKKWHIIKHDQANSKSISSDFVDQFKSNGKDIFYVKMRDDKKIFLLTPFSNKTKKPELILPDYGKFLMDSIYLGLYKNNLEFRNVYTGYKKTITTPVPINLDGVYIENDSVFWLRYQKGVLSYNFDGELLDNITTKNPFRYDTIQNLSRAIKLVNDKYIISEIWFRGFEVYNRKDKTTLMPESLRQQDLYSFITYKTNDEILIGGKKGLLVYNISEDSITKMNIPFGYLSNRINSGVKDINGNMWYGTGNGLIKFDTQKTKFKRYTKQDGLNSNFFSYVSFSDKNGLIWLSTDKGMIHFHPDSILDNNYQTPIVFTDFRLFNRSVSSGADSYLKKHISICSEITLPYNQNSIAIEFELLNFINTSQNQYAFMLEGLDHDYAYYGDLNKANYNGLKPGEYTFYAKAANNDRIWTEPISLKITILPPFWKTWWFRILIGLIIITSLILIWRTRIHQLKKRQIELENQVKERTVEIENQKEELMVQAEQMLETNEELQTQKDEIEAQSEELLATMEELHNVNQELEKYNATKDKFFSIIAHDLKNPFHAISGMSSLLNKSFEVIEDKKKKEFISMIETSSKSASSLLENLLIWSRSQTNKMKFEPTQIKISKIVNDTYGLLEVNAVKKKIELINNVNENELAFADTNMLTTIIRNLVNNALKFTPEGGKITITTTKVDKKICIVVEDTGIGIKQETIDKLFKIDQQHSTEGTSGEAGTGLGLIICQEFIEKNNGKIEVESEVGVGSKFKVYLPLS